MSSLALSQVIKYKNIYFRKIFKFHFCTFFSTRKTKLCSEQFAQASTNATFIAGIRMIDVKNGRLLS